MSAACQKDFTITVGAGCLDWTQMAWQNAFVSTQGDGTAFFTPSLSNSNSFSLAITATSPAFFTDGAATINQALLVYNGPACNCKATFTVTSIVGVLSTNWGASCQITGNLAGTLMTFQPTVVGVFDVLFSLPNCTITPQTISITSLAQTLTGLPDHAVNVAFSGIIVNV